MPSFKIIVAYDGSRYVGWQRQDNGVSVQGLIEEALRLSPRDTFGAAWLSIAGDAKLFLGRDEEAVERLKGALALNRNNPYTNFLLAAALAHLGRLNEARTSATDRITSASARGRS